MRKRTVFQLCPVHKHLGGGRRTAEIVCEGGPAYGAPCAPSPCVVRPGSDLFAAGVTDTDVADLIADWAVNRARP